MVYLCISMIDKGLHSVKYKGRLIWGVEDGFFHLKRGRKGERTAKLNNAQSASFCPATTFYHQPLGAAAATAAESSLISFTCTWCMAACSMATASAAVAC